MTKLIDKTNISCFPPYCLDHDLQISTEIKPKLESKPKQQNKQLSRTRLVKFPEFVFLYDPNATVNSDGTIGLGTDEEHPRWLLFNEGDSLKPITITTNHINPWYINIADTLSKNFGNAINTIALNENNERVKSMQNADMKLFYVLPPRKIAAGMSFVGSFAPGLPGFLLSTPSLMFNGYDVITNPTPDNAFEAFITASSSMFHLPKILQKKYILNIPTPIRATRRLSTGTTVSRYVPIQMDASPIVHTGATAISVGNAVGDLNEAITGLLLMELIRGNPHEKTFHDLIVIEKDDKNIKMYDPYLHKQTK